MYYIPYNIYYKRPVRNSYGQTSTQMISAVTFVTSPLEIEGVKDEDGPDDPTGRPIKIEVQKGVKEEEKDPAVNTMAPYLS